MSGRDAIRGFAIQAMLCLFDALDQRDWSTVVIEPDSASEKVDIVWIAERGRRAQQVKSSRNQIGRAAVEEWCRELSDSGEADEYELLLAGPVAKTVLDGALVHDVRVRTPAPVDTLDLVEQGITKLDRFLTVRGISPVPLAVRETLVVLVTGHLMSGSVQGREWHRDEFEGLLLRWVTASYPQAITMRLQANCEILWTSLVLVATRLKEAPETFGLVLPITIVNGGPGVCIVEWCAVRIAGPDGSSMLYLPIGIKPPCSDIGPASYSKTNLDGAPAFDAFAILPNASTQIQILFEASARSGYRVGLWSNGAHRAALHVKFRGLREPRILEAPPFECVADHREAIRGRIGCQITFTKVTIEDYLDSL